MTGLRVEQVGVEDTDALRLIEASESELNALYPPEHRFAFSPKQLLESGALFVVVRAPDDGEALGCGGIALYDSYGELKRIFTTDRARGRGVARAVITRLEALALRHGRELIRLETGHLSHAAISLYERLGYRRIGPFGEYQENGSSVFMEKRLRP